MIEMSGYAYYKSRTAGLVLIWAMGGRRDGMMMMTDFRLHKSHFSPFVRTDAKSRKSNGGTGGARCMTTYISMYA